MKSPKIEINTKVILHFFSCFAGMNFILLSELEVKTKFPQYNSNV